MLLFLAVLRFVTITGGVVTGEVSIDAVFAPSVKADAGSGVLDVTARPDFVVGCSYAGTLANGQSRVAVGGDTCVAPVPVKVVPSSAPAAQLTAAEWTAIQTKVAAGDATTARAAGQLLDGTDLPHAQAAVSTLATQGVITSARATTINTALAIAAVTP